LSNLRLRGVKTPSKFKSKTRRKHLNKPKQQIALELLSKGNNLVEVAQSARISRSTLYRWLHEDARFRAAYNWWRHEVEQAARARASAGAEAAMMTLVDFAAGRTGSQAIALRAAQVLLKSLGLLNPQPVGSVQPANALCEIKIEAKRETNEIGRQIAIEYFNPDELDEVPEGRDLNKPKPAPGVAEDDPDAGPNDIVFNGRKLTPEELEELEEDDLADQDEMQAQSRGDAENGRGEEG